MKIQRNISYEVKKFNDEELSLSQRMFGLIPQSVYFNFDVDLDIDIEKNKLFYVYGLSGEGKTIFKEELKKQLCDKHNVIDYDDIYIDSDKKLFELFNFDEDKEFAIKLFHVFGLFEMRNIFSFFNELSAGQQKRVKYMFLIYKAYKLNDVNSILLFDEFLTFVDSLSAKIFAFGLRKFMRKNMPNVLLFAFGCNDMITSIFEDLTITMVNGKIYDVNQIVDINESKLDEYNK